MKKILILLFSLITLVGFSQTTTYDKTRKFTGTLIIDPLATFICKDSTVLNMYSGTIPNIPYVQNYVATHSSILDTINKIATKRDVGSKEPNLGNPSTSGYVLSSTTGGTRSWIQLTLL